MSDEYIRLEIRIDRDLVANHTIEDLAEAIGITAASEAKKQLEPDPDSNGHGEIDS